MSIAVLNGHAQADDLAVGGRAATSSTASRSSARCSASSPRELAGTILAVPIVNVFGFLQREPVPTRPQGPEPASAPAPGSLTGQLAHRFVTDVVLRCDAGIDFRTGSDHRTNLPQIQVDQSIPEVERMAEAFAAPVTVNAQYRDGSLRTYCSAKGIPALVYEGGGRTASTRTPCASVSRARSVYSPSSGCGRASLRRPQPTIWIEHSHWGGPGDVPGIVRIDVYPGQRISAVMCSA